LNRRHLIEGQKAVLANEYMKALSKKRESEAGKKANEADPSHKKYPDRKYALGTVTKPYNKKENTARRLSPPRIMKNERKGDFYRFRRLSPRTVMKI